MKDIIYAIPGPIQDFTKLRDIGRKFIGDSEYCPPSSGYLKFTIFSNHKPFMVWFDTIPNYVRENSRDLTSYSLEILDLELDILKRGKKAKSSFPRKGTVECKRGKDRAKVETILSNQGLVPPMPLSYDEHWILWDENGYYSRYSQWGGVKIYTLEELISFSREQNKFPENAWIKVGGSWESRSIQNKLFELGYRWYDNTVIFKDCLYIAWDSNQIMKYYSEPMTQTLKEYTFKELFPDVSTDYPINKQKINNHEEVQRQNQSIEGGERSVPLKPYRGIGKITSSKRLVGNSLSTPQIPGGIREVKKQHRILPGLYRRENTGDRSSRSFDSCS